MVLAAIYLPLVESVRVEGNSQKAVRGPVLISDTLALLCSIYNRLFFTELIVQQTHTIYHLVLGENSMKAATNLSSTSQHQQQ